MQKEVDLITETSNKHDDGIKDNTIFTVFKNLLKTYLNINVILS
jgi:hypothetical protein